MPAQQERKRSMSNQPENENQQTVTSEEVRQSLLTSIEASKQAIELSLSEEQLQAITGGCGQCIADLRQAAKHQTYAHTYSQLSDVARNSDLLSEALRYHNESIGESRKAQTLLEGVAGRGFHFDALLPSSKMGLDIKNHSLQVKTQ
jgi:hypothetical protein